MNDTPSPSLSDAQHQEIAAALYKGNKIAAIKLYRAAAGGDLAGAKAFIERLEAELREKNPEAFTQPATSKGGCLGLLVGALSLGAFWLLR